jgi:hypothetical protein
VAQDRVQWRACALPVVLVKQLLTNRLWICKLAQDSSDGGEQLSGSIMQEISRTGSLIINCSSKTRHIEFR